MENKCRDENNKRLDWLYKNHRNWLKSVAMKLCKDVDIADDLISQLYLYLAERCDERLWYAESFNLQYCRSFIQSRFYNLAKVSGRSAYLDDEFEIEEEVYDVAEDERIDKAYSQTMEELERLSKTKQWAAARLFQMYHFSDMTLETLSKEIGISKSTSFINVKKIKNHLKEKIDNPFTPDERKTNN